MCQCDDGWAGVLCNRPLFRCLASSCANGGKCRDTLTCDCAPGWRGIDCSDRDATFEPDAMRGDGAPLSGVQIFFIVAGAIAALRTRLVPGGCQVHFVPGEAALPLYGPHGYRQYSPACLAALFPSGEIHRYGGAATNALHERWISPATRSGSCPRDASPAEYCLLRTRALDHDQQTGNAPASMYGVVEWA